MKIVTASNGKKTLKISRKEWENIGKKAGWDMIDDDKWDDSPDIGTAYDEIKKYIEKKMLADDRLIRLINHTGNELIQDAVKYIVLGKPLSRDAINILRPQVYDEDNF